MSENSPLDDIACLIAAFEEQKKTIYAHNYTDKAGSVLQQYIRFNKEQRSYVWADQTKGYYTKPKEDWLKKHGYWDEVLDRYLYKKNTNEGLVKKSRALYAEAINEIYMKHRA